VLDDLENRHPGHALVADRREKLTILRRGALPKEEPTSEPTAPVAVEPTPIAAGSRGNRRFARPRHPGRPGADEQDPGSAMILRSNTSGRCWMIPSVRSLPSP